MINHLLDDTYIPDEHFSTVLEYFEGCKGQARQQLIDKATKITKSVKDNKEENEEDEEEIETTEFKRSRQLLQSLQTDTWIKPWI